ncbi:MAG: alanine racemase [Baekduia sp.]
MTGRCEVRVNLAAIERNTASLVSAAPTAALCVVVKADGYGHGMLPAARAALAGGAGWLAVATAHEGAALRAGVGPDVPILLLGVLTADELPVAVGAGLDIGAWTTGFAEAAAAEAARQGVRARLHVKLDTGLGRLGTRDPAEADAVAGLAAAGQTTELVAGWTHFATADDRGDEFFGVQLERFGRWGRSLRERHPGVMLHAANSAAMLRDASAHFDLVRCGVAAYGLDPFGGDPGDHGLEPAMSVRATVGAVKPCAAGESAGYGRRFIAASDTTIATIPIGYGDGYRRGYEGVWVAIGGSRRPVSGTISMDNITVDLGPGASDVQPGDEAWVLGEGGPRAEELASVAGTINYEVTCGIGARPSRVHHRDGIPE